MTKRNILLIFGYSDCSHHWINSSTSPMVSRKGNPRMRSTTSEGIDLASSLNNLTEIFFISCHHGGFAVGLPLKVHKTGANDVLYNQLRVTFTDRAVSVLNPLYEIITTCIYLGFASINENRGNAFPVNKFELNLLLSHLFNGVPKASPHTSKCLPSLMSTIYSCHGDA